MFTGKVEEEVKQLRQEIREIKSTLEKSVNDDVKDARQASKKCAEYRNRCVSREEEINGIYENTKITSEEASSLSTSMKGLSSNITSINDKATEALEKIENIEVKVELVDRLFEKKDDLDDKIEELSTIYEAGNDKRNKIDAIYRGLLEKKSEVDVLYYEINGYTETNEDDETTYIEGLKDKLDKSYKDIVSDIKVLNIDVESVGSNAKSQYEEFIASEKETYETLFKKIRELLPEALTAGLSYAYSEKREAEIKTGERLSKTFSRAIYTLVGISLIPFLVNIYLLYGGKSLEAVIAEMPNMVFSILPLYAPVLWLAYSAGKKINLSKRLVEEYTHKEVISKTFEGLSTQIADIDDKAISDEFRNKLLRNILSVSSENPGKLISDYNTADHPLLDAKTPVIADALNIFKGKKDKDNKHTDSE